MISEFQEISDKLDLVSEIQSQLKKELKILQKDFKKSRISEEILSEISKNFQNYEKKSKELSLKFDKICDKMNELRLSATRVMSVDKSDWKNWDGAEFLKYVTHGIFFNFVQKRF